MILVRMVDADEDAVIGEGTEHVDFPPGRIGWVDGMTEVAAAAVEAAARAMRNRTEVVAQPARACSACGATGLAADGDACRTCGGRGHS